MHGKNLVRAEPTDSPIARMKDDDFLSFHPTLNAEQLKERRNINNPENEPFGHFTGRCGCCGSKQLWDDNLTYGCDSCGAIFILN